MRIEIHGLEETEYFGKMIGMTANAGNTIILSGELGAGKTTLTKGIAKGLGVTQLVKSPTYTIIREYQQGRLPLYHMDVYRVENAVDDLALEEYYEGDGLTVIEWGQLLGEYKPEDYLQINLEKERTTPENRILSLKSFGEKSAMLLKQMKQNWSEKND